MAQSVPVCSIVKVSRIDDGYECTNAWKIKPAHDQRHPAFFPLGLAEKVIAYYSFRGDVVLDPFAGIGTVGKAAVRLGRRFVLIEKEPEYTKVILEDAKLWLGKDAQDILLHRKSPKLGK
jgi:DNA modification methylase